MYDRALTPTEVLDLCQEKNWTDSCALVGILELHEDAVVGPGQTLDARGGVGRSGRR